MSDTANSAASPQLKSYIQRYERLEQEEDQLAEDKKALVAELKGNGFDPKTFMAVIKARRQDPAARAEAEAMFKLYMDAAK